MCLFIKILQEEIQINSYLQKNIFNDLEAGSKQLEGK